MDNNLTSEKYDDKVCIKVNLKLGLLKRISNFFTFYTKQRFSLFWIYFFHNLICMYCLGSNQGKKAKHEQDLKTTKRRSQAELNINKKHSLRS